MSTDELQAWWSNRPRPSFVFAKRLRGNETGATGAHQVGVFVPKKLAITMFPTWATLPNPSAMLQTCTSSHDTPARQTRLTWYNQGTRDEARITQWGGRASPLMDTSNTGSLIVMSFARPSAGAPPEVLDVWVCRDEHEEDVVEGWLGTVDPGTVRWFDDQGSNRSVEDTTSLEKRCAPCEAEMPPEWRETFPDATTVVEQSIQRSADGKRRTVDDLLLRRRHCEFLLFERIEHAHVMPKLRAGFETIPAFIDFAHGVTNRRKARSGRSLELHLRRIFDEVGVVYSHGATTELNKKPDFLFTEERYHDSKVSSDQLRMLAVKTTCKDRWRQILNEADRIPRKHLFTLQEGMSENQFLEMRAAGVQLVVPAATITSYPEAVRGEIWSLERLVNDLSSVSA